MFTVDLRLGRGRSVETEHLFGAVAECVEIL
jgi:hypothetical protein